MKKYKIDPKKVSDCMIKSFEGPDYEIDDNKLLREEH